MNEFMAFLQMGGHGAYVWTAYGLSLAALVAVGAWPVLGMRALLRRLTRRRRLMLQGAGEPASGPRIRP